MNQRLTPSTIALLVLAPLLWAGNAMVGRALHDLMPPITLNTARWVLALLILLPMAPGLLSRKSPMWAQWKRFTVLGLFGVGCYNTFQYMALKTSTPLNVTLVASSVPVWMFIVGGLFYGQRIRACEVGGALLSSVGVLVVMSRGQWALLTNLHLVVGDFYVLLATLGWAFYSWQLMQPHDPDLLRGNWAAFLGAQVVFGLIWSAGFSAAEWQLTEARIVWGWPLLLGLASIAIGPAVIAYRCWGVGVQRVGPAVAGFFTNLTPLFAALLSTAFLKESPQLYHAAAFVLIVMSSRRGG